MCTGMADFKEPYPIARVFRMLLLSLYKRTWTMSNYRYPCNWLVVCIRVRKRIRTILLKKKINNQTESMFENQANLS